MRRANTRGACSNCQSEERRQAARGLCSLCYRVMLKKEGAEKWVYGQTHTLKGYPFRRDPPLNAPTFESFKRAVIRHYKGRLDRLKYRGEKLKGSVDGLDLENALDHLACLAGARTRKLFHGYAGWFEDTFGPKQRRELLGVIDRVERNAERDVNLASLLLRPE